MKLNIERAKAKKLGYESRNGISKPLTQNYISSTYRPNTQLNTVTTAGSVSTGPRKDSTESIRLPTEPTMRRTPGSIYTYGSNLTTKSRNTNVVSEQATHATTNDNKSIFQAMSQYLKQVSPKVTQPPPKRPSKSKAPLAAKNSKMAVVPKRKTAEVKIPLKSTKTIVT